MRGNASAPMTLDNVTVGADRALSAPGKGLDMMLGVVLPVFQVGTAAVAIGIAEAAVQATIRHLTQARLEHLNSSLAELPTLRARLAHMRIETDRARAHLGAVLDSLESAGAGDAAAGARGQGRGDRGGGRGDGPRDAHVRRRRVRRRARPRAAVPRRARADRDGADDRSGLRLHRPGAVRPGGLLMERPLTVGAVLYDPKVSVIWEIIRDFFESQGVPDRRRRSTAPTSCRSRRCSTAPSTSPGTRRWPGSTRSADPAAPAAPSPCATPIATASRISSRGAAGRCEASPTCGAGRSRSAPSTRRRRR